MPPEHASAQLRLDDAYRAMFLFADQYVSMESNPDEGLVLFHQYMQSDPARWDDWQNAVARANAGEAPGALLIGNLEPPQLDG